MPVLAGAQPFPTPHPVPFATVRSPRPPRRGGTPDGRREVSTR
ncbi:hypothetical protein SAMN05421810_104396 [Amycolatopsis arida]|uniref:Uncharacterized protein n=1 Tax=Amycolatopsis arida TaxID=587909 RepID=A0A1I5VJ34_9PSEU|nr:hypothetical protein CLV69_11242 [Amycolatopsis arida]SFQ07525.1 hypothetical protein SAMN05421810_104396 [Amycolatopsis arida]